MLTCLARLRPWTQNKPLVSRVLLLAAHGLDAATWEAAAAAGAMPAWRARLGDPIELQARNATLAPGEPRCLRYHLCIGQLGTSLQWFGLEVGLHGGTAQQTAAVVGLPCVGGLWPAAADAAAGTQCLNGP